jgi:hypothetical protein
MKSFSIKSPVGPLVRKMAQFCLMEREEAILIDQVYHVNFIFFILEKEVDEEDILVSDNIQMIYLGTDA